MEKVLLIISAAGLCAVLCHAERRYHFVYEAMNMADARSYCREKYTDLATIDDMNDVKILNDMADLSRMVYSESSSLAWIGLYDDVNSWRWSLTNTSFYKPGESEFRNWIPGEPNNHRSREYCVSMYKGLWIDKWCEFLHQPVCMNVSGSNVKFVLAPTAMSWSDAVIYCREHHTDLASVRNMEENQEIKELASGVDVWIGLSRESWKWLDGSRSTFRYWSHDRPSNQAGKETCVAADFGNSGKWGDWLCQYKRAFICYSALTGSKQVMKVRLVKKSSNLDLNDPAVLEDMLKEFRQNLRDQGVTQDVRLSWRKQADGKVFHQEKKKKRMTRKTEL